MSQQRTIAVVTGTRAEFGLLTPVMRAIDAHNALQLQVIATGTHLLPPAYPGSASDVRRGTIEEVRAAFRVHTEIPMQEAGRSGRDADAIALGRGVQGFAEHFARDRPDVVLVLGDRIEAFAAASAASVAGIHVAHVHGGDRAEGIADEAIRHAICKLAHVHFPATDESAKRLERMGEHPSRIMPVGSPAIDGIDAIAPMNDATFAALGEPGIVFLMHPCGRDERVEHDVAHMALEACCEADRVLALHPNHDPGREGIIEAIKMLGRHEGSSGRQSDETHGSSTQTITVSPSHHLTVSPHLERHNFIGLLKRVRCLVGNSSAGLIECAALGVPVVNIGDRQSGRERGSNVLDAPECTEAIREAIRAAKALNNRERTQHPYGNGTAGPQIAADLAEIDLDALSVRKLNTY